LFCRNTYTCLFTLASLLASVPGRVVPRRVVVFGCLSTTRRIIASGRTFDVGFSFVGRLRRRFSPEESFPFADNRRRWDLNLVGLGNIAFTSWAAAYSAICCRCRTLLLFSRGCRNRISASFSRGYRSIFLLARPRYRVCAFHSWLLGSVSGRQRFPAASIISESAHIGRFSGKFLSCVIFYLFKLHW